METAIAIDHVSVVRGGVDILKDVNTTIYAGKITAVIGPNGAGKTTLLGAILGLIPHEGEVVFFPERKHSATPRIGYVPQRVDFDRGAPITVFDFLSLSIQRRPLWFGYSKKKIVQEGLEKVEAVHLEKRMIGSLSGGEFQRVLLALALQVEPDILLLDEPASGVDLAGEELFCDFLSNLQNEGKFTLVLVSHDLSVVSSHADRVLCLNRTVSCSGKTSEVLTSANLDMIYGVHHSIYHHDHQCDSICPDGRPVAGKNYSSETEEKV